MDEIFKQPAKKSLFVPTSHGAMKVQFADYHFVHHFTRNRIARYRCESFDKLKCSAIVFVKDGCTYPHNQFSSHNHQPPKHFK